MNTNPQAREQTASISRMGPLDILLLVLLASMILSASWFRTRGRIFWSDEIMGWLVLRQETWSHLLRAWYGGIDSSGLFFYVFAKPWLRLFGHTELALHLFSATGMALGFGLTWLCARRFYRFQVVASVLPLVFFLNRTSLWQLANGRTYGVLMASVALICYALVRTSPDEKHIGTAGSIALVLAASLLLVGSHILGALYWGFFFAGFLGRDAWFRVFRPHLYLASLAGLILLPLSWRNLVATAALGKPTFWTLKPTVWDLSRGLDDFSHKTGILMLVAILLFLVLFVIARMRGKPESLLLRSRATLYILLAIFLLMACGIFLVSQVSTSIFVDRYMLPMMIGDSLFLCELASRITAMLRINPRAQTIGAAAALVAACGAYIADLRFEAPYPQRDYTTSLLRNLPPADPVILTSPGVFAEMVFYRNAARRFETPIDWQVQLDPDAGPGGVSGMHEMENWKSYGFYADQIMPTAVLLAGKRRFTVVSDAQHTLWLRRRILQNPAYHVTELAPYPFFDTTLRIWQVSAN